MFDIGILTSHAFLVVAAGTFLLAAATGAIGCITVLKGQSLIGDAIGHSSFPGIVLFFMIFMVRDPLILIFGAIFSGTIAFIVIQTINANSKLELDAVLAIVLSSFFGLGMVLKSYIQGNSRYAKASQSGLQNYIFGQAAYIMKEDVRIIFIVSLLVLALLIIFYKEIKVFLFDITYAKTIGLNTTLLYGVILFMTMSLISTGLKLVGAILISALLIVPAITAMQWSTRFSGVLVIAALTGGISAIIGTYISTAYNGMSTGATIILVMNFFALISLVVGPHGMIANFKKRRQKNGSIE